MSADTHAASGLALCVVNRDGAAHLPLSLPGLQDCAPLFDELVIADDASQDDSPQCLAAALPRARILRAPAPRGPAAGRNAALAATSAARALFVDVDVRITRDAVLALGAALDAAPDAAVAVPRVLHAGDPAIVQFEGADAHFTGLQRLRLAERADAECPNRSAACSSLVSACFLLDRRRAPPGPLFDESFFFSLEDHGAGVRLRVLGCGITSAPAARVLHGTGTPGLSYRRGRAYPEARLVRLVRNRWKVVLTHFELRTLVVCAPALALYELVQLVGLARRGWLAPWVTALRELLGDLPRLRATRREIQRARRTADRAILVGGPLPFTVDLARSPFERGVKGALDRLFDGYWRIARHALRSTA